MPEPVILVANGDLRLTANQKCWPAQSRVEESVMSAIRSEGFEVRRGHPYDAAKQHGFINSQKRGMEVFRDIPIDAPLVVVEAVWQYSHHLLHGLYTHRGPILTVANWSGEWPGLVGLLNLNGSLTKAGVKYSSLWSVDFTDDFFRHGLARWLRGETLQHDTSHVRPLSAFPEPERAVQIGSRLAADLHRNKAILGVFDEGCMGMYNAIIPDELLHATGVSRSGSASPLAVRQWLERKGLRFLTGPKPEASRY